MQSNHALAGMFKTSNQAQKRGFTATGWPQQTHKLTRLELKIDVFQRPSFI